MRVLMLDIDGLQPAYLGPYGCEWAPTPTWDNLAVAGVVFDEHFADCPDPTVNAGWRSGQQPRLGGTESDLLADFRSAGVLTARVGPAAPAGGWNIDVATKRGSNPLGLNSTRRATRQVIEQLGVAPHAFLRIEIDALLPPWQPSEEAWADCFGDEETVEPWTGALPDRIAVDDDDTFARIQNTYAAAVTTLDSGLGKLLADCSKRGWNDEAAWILTASRGFPLGEHGAIGFTAPDVHEELIHLPLLLRWPGGDHAGTRVHGFTQPADLAATLRELFHLPAVVANNWATGRSLLSAAREEACDLRQSAVSQICHGDRTCWGYRTAGWYLMADDRPDAARRLFAKPDDRWEVNDVAARNQEQAEEQEIELKTLFR